MPKRSKKDETIVVLKIDGEIWECGLGWDHPDATDENCISGVKPIPKNSTSPNDIATLAKGVTHRQQGHISLVQCYEIRKLGEVGDGKTYR